MAHLPKTARKTVLLINGPNLDMLGRRDPSQYGTFTLKEVEAAFTAKAKTLGVEARCFQSNHEGALIEVIHGAIGFPTPAVLGHEGGTLLVVLNGLRLLADPIRTRSPA